MTPQNSIVSLPSKPLKNYDHPNPYQFHKEDQVVSQFKSSQSHILQDSPKIQENNAIAPFGTEASMVEDTGRERLKRHRVEVAGRVWIPDIWGQEELLKDWIDCTAFDASLGNNSIVSARAALVEEGRRANSSGLRIENSCAKQGHNSKSTFNA